MKYLKVLIFAIGLTFFGCNQNEEVVVIDEEQTENLQEGQIMTDEEQIQNLIRKVLTWSAYQIEIDFLPVVADSKRNIYKDSNYFDIDDSSYNDSLYIGFNMKEHKKNLEKLKNTDFFATEFIENYDKIIRTLDKKMRNKEFREWYFGDWAYAPFNFLSNLSPWHLCMEIPHDNPNLWDVEIEIVSLTDEKGKLKYKWGEKVIADPEWGPYMKDFRYEFSVKKEDNKWKISYMEGFDFKKGIEAWE